MRKILIKKDDVAGIVKYISQNIIRKREVQVKKWQVHRKKWMRQEAS
jgi:hypothetical protein